MLWRETAPTRAEPADDGEDVLQGVDGALERVLEGVGGGEHAELREHDVAHAHGVEVGLQEEALVFHVGADEDEGSEHDEPHVGHRKPPMRSRRRWPDRVLRRRGHP